MSATIGGRIVVVMGTRPEVVKCAPVLGALGDEAVSIATGQHFDRSLFGSFLDDLGVRDPVAALAIGGARRGAQLGAAVSGLTEMFAAHRPLAVVVQGDTTTALAGALAANAEDIPVVHVEAGLRSFDRAMPEEHNRVLVDHISDLCLAPTDMCAANLMAESIPASRIVVTGNTVVDALAALLPGPGPRAEVLRRLGLQRERFIVSTLHRPENVDGDRLAPLLAALADLPLAVVLPMHPRTKARAEAAGLHALLDRLHVLDPLPYATFLALAAECALLVADSGGVQEEVSVLGRPLVVVRNSTERPEVLGTWATLVSDPAAIAEAAAPAIAEPAATHARLIAIPSPYGTGDAGERSAAAIRALLAT